jgi:lipooligosaccharide transport system ATP-binding protein
MDEAEQLCDRLVVMDGGVIVAEGAPAELIGRYSTREVLELRFEPEHRPAGDVLGAVLAGHAERIEELPDRLLVYTGNGESAQAAVAAAGHRPLTALVRRSSLEDVFLRLTGRTLVD